MAQKWGWIGGYDESGSPAMGWVVEPDQPAAPQKQWWEEVAESRPEYQSVNDPSGMLKSQYQMDLSGYNKELQDRLDAIKLDKRGLEAFRGEALRTGPSAWYNLMLDRQKLEEQTGGDNALTQALSQTAGARSQLAQKGGLYGGASERLARAGSRDALMAKQQIARQGMATRAELGTKDEEKRMQALSQLPGMEVQALQPELQKTQMWNTGQAQAQQAQQWNLQQALEEERRKQQAEMDAWKETTTARAAERQAVATEESGK